MTNQSNERVLVAPTSTHGHFVKNHEQVIQLDSVNETFHVKGSSILETANHTDLEMESDCLITCQVSHNPFTGLFEKAKD